MFVVEKKFAGKSQAKIALNLNNFASDDGLKKDEFKRVCDDDLKNFKPINQRLLAKISKFKILFMVEARGVEPLSKNSPS